MTFFAYKKINYLKKDSPYYAVALHTYNLAIERRWASDDFKKAVLRFCEKVDYVSWKPSDILGEKNYNRPKFHKRDWYLEQVNTNKENAKEIGVYKMPNGSFRYAYRSEIDNEWPEEQISNTTTKLLKPKEESIDDISVIRLRSKLASLLVQKIEWVKKELKLKKEIEELKKTTYDPISITIEEGEMNHPFNPREWRELKKDQYESWYFGEWEFRLSGNYLTILYPRSTEVVLYTGMNLPTSVVGKLMGCNDSKLIKEN